MRDFDEYDFDNRWDNRNYSEKEKEVIALIEEAKKYVKDELELHLQEDGWYALDYRSDYEAALPIENDKYNKPLITEEYAKENNIDVRACCDYCGVWYVG